MLSISNPRGFYGVPALDRHLMTAKLRLNDWLVFRPEIFAKRFESLEAIRRQPLKVITARKPDGRWQAITGDYDLGDPIGYGDTAADAETDLRYILQECENEAAMEKLRALGHVHRELRKLKEAS